MSNKKNYNLFEKLSSSINNENNYYKINFKYIYQEKTLIFNHNLLNVKKQNYNFDKKELDLITSLFHIYDDSYILNEQYGGSNENFIKVLNLLENYIEDKEISKFQFSKMNMMSNQKLLNDLYDLNNFFENPEIHHFFLNFGAYEHTTMIYLTKVSQRLIKAVYINTGEGVDETVFINHNYNTYYDINKTIYFNIEMRENFINFLKPFLFFRYIKNEITEDTPDVILDYMFYVINKNINSQLNIKPNPININMFDADVQIDDDEDDEIFKAYKNWCIKMFKILLLDKNDNYNYINNFFNFDKFKNILINTPFDYTEEDLLTIETDRKILGIRSEQLYKNWQVRSNEYIDESPNESIKSFLIKSYNNIDFISSNNLLLFKLQQSGTCTYKSILVAVIYHLLSYDKYEEYINKFYFYLSMENYIKLINFYENIKNYEKGIIENPTYCISITDNLINDKILEYKFNHINLLRNNINKIKQEPINVNVKHINNNYKTHDSSYIFKFNYERINEILNEIRNGKDIKLKIERLILEYKSNIEKKNILFTYYELMYICILWEYYFNHKFWKDRGIFDISDENYMKLNTQIPIQFNSLTRLQLRISELSWILYFYLFFSCDNFIEPKVNPNINYISNTILLKQIINQERLIKQRNLILNNVYNFKERSTLFFNNNIYAVNINPILILLQQTEDNYYVNRNSNNFNNSSISFNRSSLKRYKDDNNNLITQIIENMKKISIKEVYSVAIFLMQYYYYFNKVEIYNIVKKIYKCFYEIYKDESKLNNSNLTIELLLINFLLDDYYFIRTNSEINIVDIKNINSYELSILDYRDNKNKYPIEIFYHDIKFEINIIEQLINAFHNNVTINDKVILDILASYSFKLNTVYLKYENEGNILYKNEIGEYVNDKCEIVTDIGKNFILGNFLFHNDDYCFISKTKLFIVTNYNYDNLVIIFNIDRIDQNNFKLKNDIIIINSNNVKLSNNLKKYPFLAFAPKLTLNFISIDKNNNIGVYSIVNYKHDYNSDGIFNKITHDIEIKEYIYISIKDNYLTPVLNNNNFIEKLNIFYNYYHKLFLYINDEPYDIKNSEINIETLSLPSIENILNLTNDEIYKILNNITKKVPQDNLHLINWLNVPSSIITLDNYGIDAKYNCDTLCDNITDQSKNIIALIDKLKILLSYLTNKLKHDPNYKSYLEFIENNIPLCSYIMKTNIYIKNLIRLNEIIKNCDKLSCHEILEINDLFERKDKIFNSKLAVMVEIIFGNIIRREQWNKINEIYNNFLEQIYGVDKQNKFKIHQFMMGKGKSSLITPMLVILLSFAKRKLADSKIYIVVPTHLIKQTHNTFIEYKKIFNLNEIILSDNDIKLKFLNNNLTDNDIYIIDEFDYMYNPLQSNFNIIKKEENVDIKLISNIFELIEHVKIKKQSISDNKYSLEEEVLHTIKDFNDETFIKNVSFGMSYENNDRICIPYLRKDNPIEGSKFSSNIITIVLTMLYFYNKEYNTFILDIDDIKLINKNDKILLKNIFLILDPTITIHDTTNIEEIYDNISIEIKKNIPLELIKKYFILIFLKFKESTEIKNCSFIDIINKKTIWQVGYSGTVNINMNIQPFTQLNNYDSTIIKDPDEYKNVSNAILKNKATVNISQTEIDYLISKSNDINSPLLNKLSEYNVIIDCCALFKDIDNTKLALLLNAKTKKIIIFLLSDNTKKICKEGRIYNYEYFPYKTEQIIYYYSQKHIVGIDFKQPNLLKGLLILNEKNKYTEVAQAIYRMRKLNKGHDCDIGIFNSTINKTEDVLKLIEKNEESFNINNKELLELQYFKCYNRQITKNYSEIDLHPLYYYKPINETNIRDIIKMKMMNNIKQPRNELLLRTYNKIINYPLEILLKIIFSKNSIEHIIQLESENVMEAEVYAEGVIETENEILYIQKQYFKNYEFINYKFNPYKTVEEFSQFVYLEFDLLKNTTNIKLLFSYSLLYNYLYGYYTKDTFIIIEISDNVFLFENIFFINHYIPIAPVYNKNGIIMNESFFPSANKRINLEDTFNIALTNEIFELNLGYILFNIPIENLEKHYMDINIIDKLAFLIYYSDIDVFNLDNEEIYNIQVYLLAEESAQYMIELETIYKKHLEKENIYIDYISDYINMIPLNRLLSDKINYKEFTKGTSKLPRRLTLSNNKTIRIITKKN